MKNFFNRLDQEIPPRKIFLAILLFGLLHGLTYVFLMPAWQHYDEPTHFEYAWMIAHQNRIPQTGEFDNTIRREIQVSMIKTGLFSFLQQAPLDQPSQEPIWIGTTQVGDPPLYYLLASIPLRLTSQAPVQTQLYAGRLLSLSLFLLIIVVSHFFAKELFSPGPLRWMLPLMVAGLPGLVDLTSAFSSDSAAILFYSLYLLFGVRLIKSGIRVFDLVGLGLALVCCLLTKSSTWIAFLNFPFLLALVLFSRKVSRLAWGVIGVGILGLGLGLFQFDDAALWFRDTKQAEPTRLAVQTYDVSGMAMQLSSDPGAYPNALFQSIPVELVQPLAGQDVTIGVWMWADRSMEVNAPMLALITDKKVWLGSDHFQLTPQPRFYARTVRLPSGSRRINFELAPFKDARPSGVVYFYAPILVPGGFSAASLPEFLDPGKTRLRWNGVEVSNLVRNSGAAWVWPRFRPQIVSLAYQLDYRLGDGLAWLLYSLDIRGVFWYIRSTSSQIFQTFWAKFGWGSILLAGGKPYAPIKVASAVGALGVIIGLFVHFRTLHFRVVFWLTASLLLSLVYAWFTGISTGVYVDRGVIPVARFIYPSVLVILSGLCAGWYQAARLLLPNRSRLFALAFLAALWALDLYSIYSIARYFALLAA